MTPKQVVEKWVEAFNRTDVKSISARCSNDAINHQVVNEPLYGKEAITTMFTNEFAAAEIF